MRGPSNRKHLSAQGLLQSIRSGFEEIPDPKRTRKFPLSDVMMSALAMFSLKYPSLLQFERSQSEEVVRHNLKTLYGVSQAPSDTYMRERLDEVDPEVLEPVYKRLFALLQRGKGLEGFEVLDGRYVLSVDGTGLFSSQKVHCAHCCSKHHRDGRVTYYHQLLGAVLVHPECREVIPLMPEPILKGDGSGKNDCERNAARRLLQRVRRNHPHLRLLVVEDGLASNGPHIRLLESLDMRYVLGAKEGDHRFLYDWVSKTRGVPEHECRDEQGVVHRFRYLNGVPLNDDNFDLEVNFLEYREHRPGGKVQRFCWVTDIPIDESNLMELMRAGRARWKIENETFNTLKNQGYGLEHNYGHGHKHLSTVLMHLMMLAFLVDQIQLRCCAVFNAAHQAMYSRAALWRKMRGLFGLFLIDSWEKLYRVIARGYRNNPALPEPP